MPCTKYPSSEYVLIIEEGESESFQEVQSTKVPGSKLCKNKWIPCIKTTLMS